MVCEFYYELFKHWHLRPGVNPESLPIVLNLDESDDEGQDFSTLFVIKDEYEEILPQEPATPAQAATPVTPPAAAHMEDSGAAAGLEGTGAAAGLEDSGAEGLEECVEGRVGGEQSLGGEVGADENPNPVVEVNFENSLEASEPAMVGAQEDEVDDPYPEPEPDVIDTPSKTETAAASAPEKDPFHGKCQQARSLETLSSDDVEQRIQKLKFLASMFWLMFLFFVPDSEPR